VEDLAQRGPALLLDLRGMFAFAAYDHHKQQQLLGHDRFGIPLYMALEENSLRFASERRALPGDHELSPQAISQMQAWGHLSSPVEMVPPATAGVHSLPAGLVVRFNRDRSHRPVRYWAPNPGSTGASCRFAPQLARSFLRDQLESAVSEQPAGRWAGGLFSVLQP
jgi:asparagine synthetase B (glutamine-hydrolysing)